MSEALEYFKQGQEMEAVQELNAALEMYQQASICDRKQPEPWNAMGNIYYQLGQMDNACQAWARAYAMERFDQRLEAEQQPELQVEQQINHLLAKNLPHYQTIAHFFIALRWFPDSYIPENHLEAHFDYWQQAMLQHPQSLQACIRLAQVCAYLGDLENAHILFEQCQIQANPEMRKKLGLHLMLEFLKALENRNLSHQNIASKNWKDLRLLDPRRIERWQRQDLTPDEVEIWRQHGFGPLSAGYCKTQGWTPADALQENVTLPIPEPPIEIVEVDLPIVHTFANGLTKTRGKALNGLRQGDWIFYDTEGRKKESGQYLEGKRDGIWYWWHSNGTLSQQGEYWKGKKEGLWITWNQDGQPLTIEEYYLGKKCTAG